MNWENDELRAAALRLLIFGSTRVTKVAEPLLGELEELGLVEQSRRAGLLTLRTGQLEKLRRYLAVRWPQVSEAEEVFNSQPHNISATALRTLRRSPLTLPKGIVRLNRKTWSAWAGAHSKSGLATPPDGLVLTTDEGLRLRANAGLQIVDEEGASLDFDQWQSVLGEITIPQRAFARRWFISGVMPKLVLTVENLGAFVDFPSPSWLLLVHAPGRNTDLATRFIDRIPMDAPWIHFGDLDPAGLNIALSIRSPERGRKPLPWIPRSAALILETHSLFLEVPWSAQALPPRFLDDPVLAWLIKHQRWLEHEPVVLLADFEEELGQLLQRG